MWKTYVLAGFAVARKGIVLSRGAKNMALASVDL
jgi:hypothetical protein